jgi:hypothetical protein
MGEYRDKDLPLHRDLLSLGALVALLSEAQTEWTTVLSSSLFESTPHVRPGAPISFRPLVNSMVDWPDRDNSAVSHRTKVRRRRVAGERFH